MRKHLVWMTGILILVMTVFATCARAQTAGASIEELKKKVETYLRYMFAFGPDVKLTVGDFKETGEPSLLKTTITVHIGENKEDATMWVTKDGKFLLRGEMVDMGKDGFAENRAKLDLKNAPSTGNPNATVTIVEFADFECPVCKQLHDGIVLRQVRAVTEEHERKELMVSAGQKQQCPRGVVAEPNGSRHHGAQSSTRRTIRARSQKESRCAYR